MKRIALMLSLLLIFSVSLFAANTSNDAANPNFRAFEQKIETEKAQKNGPQILGETVIYMEDFEGAPWILDSGYGELAGDPAVSFAPTGWALSDAKSNSPVTALMHDDNLASGRDFAISPFFEIPTEIDGDPVVSAKLSYMLNIDTPGWSDPLNPGYLGDYYMVYAGVEEVTWESVDVEGDMVYYSGYPEENSFQYLTSPEIDLTAAAGAVMLDFKYLMINELHWDLGRVDVLVDGVATNVGMLNDDSGVWMDMSIDLSAFAGQTVQVQVAWLPDDATAIEGGGLWLNDIAVSDDNGVVWADDGTGDMVATGMTLSRLFYDYDRVGDAGAAWHPWGEADLFNGSTDLFDLGLQAGDNVCIAVRFIADSDVSQGEEASAGIFFDDFSVVAISGVPADAGLSDLAVGYPQTAGLDVPVAATVSNFGFEGQTVALWYMFDDNAATPVPPFLSLDAFQDSTVVFMPAMPEADSTVLAAYTMLQGDAVPENDGLATMIYPYPAGMAQINNGLGAVASVYIGYSALTFMDPLSKLGDAAAYNLDSFDVYFYNPSGVEEQCLVTIGAYSDDPLSPTQVLFEETVTIPGDAGNIIPMRLPVGAAGLTDPISALFDMSVSGGGLGIINDGGSPFGTDYLLDGDVWYSLGRGYTVFANVSYSLEPAFGIAIDAEKDAWYETLTGTQDGKVILPASSYNTNGEPDDDADLSAVLWAAWDETYLYMYEEVKDNVVACDNATSWQNDVLEVYLDPDPMGDVTQGQIGFHITALDSADAPEAAWPGIINLRGHNIPLESTPADYARKKTDDGYVLEVRVPWAIISDATRGPIMPEVGNVFGMATMNHDNDAGTREGSVSFATFLNDNVWNTPAHHGTVTFMEDHKLAFAASNLRDETLVNLRAEVYESNTLPAPWRTLDIGDAMDAPGTAEYMDGKVTVMTSGSDIWGTKDDLRHTFITMSGDVEITAQVARLDSVHNWAKAGVMVRDNLSDSSAHVIMAMTTGNGDAMQGRTMLGGESFSVHNSADPIKAPYFVKLIKMGNMFYGYSSPDGQLWDFVGKQEVMMTDPVQVGLAATSHVYGVYTTAEFTDIAISTEPMEPKLNFNMVIDAAKDAWYNVLTGPDDGYLSVSAAAYNTNGQPDNADDLSAMMWTAWDSTYLYMYEEVKDNVVACDNATSWQNDVLEVYLDPDPMAEVTQGQIGFHITALDSADAPEAAWPGIINLRGHNIALEATTDDYARKKVTGGYVLEVRVPWNIMLDATRGPIVPEVGTMFGMAFMNHDNDAGTREGSVSFATVLNDNIWNTPQHHGTVEFLADHKLKLSATNLRADSLVNPVAALYAPNALPEEWLAMDIGAVGTPGVFTENGGVWEITASGSDVWGTADEFSMAFQVYKGDVDVTAMVSGLTEVHEWGKAGVVIRDELTPGSAHAIMAITTTHGAAMQYRAEADGISSSIHDLDYTIDVKTPQYVKIQRLGDLFQGWISEDGKAWLKVGAVEIPMSEQIYVGLGVVSHDNAAVSKATFEKVSIKTKNINAVDEDVVAGLPTEFALNQNYPNPFNPTTTINFELPRDVKVKLTIYDILGREVTTLVDEQMEAGIHNVQFDAARYASGVYFYHLKAGDRVFSKKMMLLK